MKPKTIALLLTAALGAGGLTGCTTAKYVQHSPESYLGLPNSNVTPLGPVKVSVSGDAAIFAPPSLVTADNDTTVYQAALAQQPGANLVIDYTKIYTGYVFWPIFWEKLELEGTACKMTGGQQILK